MHIEDVMNAARVTDVSPPTASRHFKKHLGVNWRLPRAEPLRTEDDVAARVDMRAKWKHLPNGFFTDPVSTRSSRTHGAFAPPLGCLALPEHGLCVSADIRQHARRACMCAVFRPKRRPGAVSSACRAPSVLGGFLRLGAWRHFPPRRKTDSCHLRVNEAT